MTLCTLALGKRHSQLARRLSESLPTPIQISTEIPADVPKRSGDRQYDYHNKLFAIERHLDLDGTLFLDADAICVDHGAFLAFVQSLTALPAGLYSPYTFSSYGFRHPSPPGRPVDRSRLTAVLRFMDSVLPLAEEDLLAFRMPYEWLMFFRFASGGQAREFFDRFHYLHAMLVNSTCTLGNDCNLIGLAAQHCRLPVVSLRGVSGIHHKK